MASARKPAFINLHIPVSTKTDAFIECRNTCARAMSMGEVAAIGATDNFVKRLVCTSTVQDMTEHALLALPLKDMLAASGKR